MRFLWFVLPCVVLLALPSLLLSAAAQEIVLHAEDAVVWAQDQVVEGMVDGVDVDKGTLFVGDDEVAFDVDDGAFAVPIRLQEGSTSIYACVASITVCSDTLRYTLGFSPRPEAELRPTAEGRTVTLRGHVLENPGDLDLTFSWEEDDANPVGVNLQIASDSVAAFTIPQSAPVGEYYFNWVVEAGDGDRFRARTFVTVTDTGVVAFDLMEDHAAWVDDAIIYEIAPRLWSDYKRGRLDHITDRIPELVGLGINTIWLQPIFPYGAAPTAAQMYDVTDYFEVWDALGTKEDLKELVETAHLAGLRVMLDFVANHSSIEHPYAQDAIEHGPRSHYYDFYMREGDGAPYGRYYETLRRREMTFIYYFWDDLVTWNYENPEVERFIIEASRYWIEAFDIDGYRFDAVWGPHARDPEFTQRWRRAMKRVKPEVLLLAEAKAPYSDAYAGTGHPDNFESFDVAYDWTDSGTCISQWAWARRCEYSAYDDGTHTVFNSGVEGLRARDLHNALTNYGDGYPDDAVILRYLENNDLPRFRVHHTVEQTRMAAALLFALDGVPMLYYGQALGTPYQYPSYPPGDPLTTYDRDGMWAYYQHLIRLRKQFDALTGPNRERVRVAPAGISGHVYAFRRWLVDENILAAVNMADEAVNGGLLLPVEAMDLQQGTTYHLTDLFSGDSRALTVADLDTVKVELPARTTRLWVLADSAVVIPTGADVTALKPSAEAALLAAYPNPFQDVVTLSFETAQSGPVRLAVYDLLGRRIATLLEETLPAGRHEVRYDGGSLAAGPYVYRLKLGNRVRSGMLLKAR